MQFISQVKLKIWFYSSYVVQRQKNSHFIHAEDKACNALHGKRKMGSEHYYSIGHTFQDYNNHFQASSHVVQAQRHHIIEAVQ